MGDESPTRAGLDPRLIGIPISAGSGRLPSPASSGSQSPLGRERLTAAGMQATDLRLVGITILANVWAPDPRLLGISIREGVSLAKDAASGSVAPAVSSMLCYAAQSGAILESAASVLLSCL